MKACAASRTLLWIAMALVVLANLARATATSTPPGGEATALEEVVLSNGLHVLVGVPGRQTPLTNLVLLVDAGEADDGSVGRGATWTAADVAFERELPDGEPIARALARNGVVSEVAVGRNQTSFSFVFPEERIGALLQLLAGTMIGSPPSQGAWQRAIDNWVTTDGQRSKDAYWAASDALDSRLWSTHRSASADGSNVTAARLDVLQRFRNVHYRPENMLVGIVAPQPVEETTRVVAEALGGWRSDPLVGSETMPIAGVSEPPSVPNSTVSPVAGAPPALSCLRTLTTPAPILTVGYALDSVSLRDGQAWRALAHILGGSSNSRLNRRLRLENQWVYTVQAQVVPAGDDGLTLMVSTQTPEPTAAHDAIVEEVERLRTELVSSAEREGAASVLISRRQLDRSSLTTRMRLRRSELLSAPASGWNEYLSPASLSSEQLQRVAQRYLGTARAASVVVSAHGDAFCGKGAISGAGEVREGRKARAIQETERQSSSLPLGFPAVPVPDGAASTPVKIDLGKRLFFDQRLSSDGTISCSSCHRPEVAFADTTSVSTGVNDRSGSRNAPSLLNVGYAPSLFWDGRVTTLEEQVLYPISHPNEMSMRERDVVSIVAEDENYAEMFERAFGAGDITFDHVSMAIAAYERTLLSGNSDFDRFYYCDDEKALSQSGRRGWELFRSTAGCISCHRFDEGHPLFTDFDFHNTGVGWDRRKVDLGRYRLTHDRSDRGRFRTPSLRNVANTAPYMHDGRFQSIAEVLEFYDSGGFPNRYLDERIQPLELTDANKRDLTEFLNSLTGGSAPTGPDCGAVGAEMEGGS